ncbi:cAMP-dependent protein kinase type II regulatory subunit-like [Uloborus diversus]|uniref:cAMP-dependent protein kinase type II regulatory subunit-like n=1 Tax=Uloborus diversus TaxID=327109 RepID=UPI002409B0E1|nr:cAMP-dependent protein kinase type II regulatory subunit-like [Uloborus diversus]
MNDDTDNRQIAQIAEIPPELDNMLLNFTINVLLEKPDDLYNHAAEYFCRLRDENASNTAEKDKISDTSDGEAVDEGEIARILGARNSRRSTVFGEAYNPEEDYEEEVQKFPKNEDEYQTIKNQMRDVFLFRVMDEVALDAVIESMQPRKVEQGEIVIEQGDDGDYFYLIDKGNFEAFEEEPTGSRKSLKKYEGSGSFGELALLHNQPRAATVVALTNGKLWAMDRASFNRLVVKRAYNKRKAYMKLLEGVPELQPLTEYEKMQLCDALVPVRRKKGDNIVIEGDEGDGMYIIEEGMVKVVKGNKEICKLGKASYFGEMALVKHQPRAATVTAVENTKLAFLDVQAFERLLGPCMDILKKRMESYK